MFCVSKTLFKTFLTPLCILIGFNILYCEAKNCSKELQKDCLPDVHIAALILARGGSKGIKLKNLAQVGSVSLLRRSLNAILDTKLFDSVWVSTDHQWIADEGTRGGAKIHNRSKESATDTASSIFAVQEFLKYHEEINILALIQCTSPFIQTEYITQAYHKIIGSINKNCVFSVTRSFKLRWQQISDSDEIKPVNFDVSKRPRRQDWNGELLENGMFYFANTELLKEGKFQDESCGFVEIPPLHSLEIDDIFDLKIANLMCEFVCNNTKEQFDE